MNIRFSQAAIEVYSAGKHFNTFEDYKKVNQNATVLPVKIIEPVFQVKEAPPVLDPGLQKMSNLSYNNGVSHVVFNFEQNWKNPKPRFIVGSDQLEYAIAQAMKNQHEPTLVISDPKKLRIMSFDPQQNISFKGSTKKLDKTIKK